MTMARQPHYGYQTVPPRHVASHGTSSAFSSSANPDEDWTKISDLAERRRIQNRIAQRNYRKKLKRRLEDLERRAGSSSVSPPPPSQSQSQPQSQSHSHSQSHSQSQSQTHVQKSKQTLSPGITTDPRHQFKRSPDQTQSYSTSSKMLPNQYTPPSHPDEILFPPAELERDVSRSPPLFGAYHSYPAPEEVSYASYANPQAYRPGTSGDGFDYLAPAAVTLPSMIHFNEAIKRDAPIDPMSSPYGMYEGLPALHIPVSHAYDDSSNAHTPPLSYSYEHSTDSSESGYHFPTTPPLSLPSSPRPLV